MIPFHGTKKPNSEMLSLLDNCQAFSNPVKARTTIAKQQIHASLDVIKSVTTELSAEVPQTSSTENSSGASATTPVNKTQKFFNAVGWTKDHLSKVENVMGQYLGIMDTIQNFSIEQIKDMPIIVGALNQYVTDREVLGCSMANEVFSFLNGHGAELLRGIGVNVDELNQFAKKARDFITASTKDFNEAVKRFQNWIPKATEFLSRIQDLATNWRSEVEAAIQANLEAIEEVMRGNINSYLARILPTWLSNSCLGQAIGPAISEQMKSVISRVHR